MRYTLKKEERLNSKLLIAELFSEGKSFFIHPFRVTYLRIDRKDDIPVQLLISVSKRNFSSAVKRNKIKRLIRESYRNIKHILWNDVNKKSEGQLLVSVVYIGKSIVTYTEMERKLILILHRLNEKDA